MFMPQKAAFCHPYDEKCGLVSRPSLADIFRKVDTMSRIGSKKAGRRARRQFSEKFMVGAARLVLDEAEPEPDFPARQT